MKTTFLTVLLSLAVAFPGFGRDAANATEARKMFDNTYKMVFGDQGSTLHYNVNIIGILKVDGNIWYKGKKSKFAESRYLSWNDGVKDYWVDQKKKTVTLYQSGSEKKDKYAGKFEFHPNDYNYSWENCKEGYVINIDARKKTKGIKHIKAVIDKKTKAPISLKIKVMWFWTTVKISHFQSGNIDDDEFVFPAAKYKGYKFYDERGK